MARTTGFEDIDRYRNDKYNRAVILADEYVKRLSDSEAFALHEITVLGDQCNLIEARKKLRSLEGRFISVGKGNKFLVYMKEGELILKCVNSPEVALKVFQKAKSLVKGNYQYAGTAEVIVLNLESVIRIDKAKTIYDLINAFKIEQKLFPAQKNIVEILNRLEKLVKKRKDQKVNQIDRRYLRGYNNSIDDGSADWFTWVIVGSSSMVLFLLAVSFISYLFRLIRAKSPVCDASEFLKARKLIVKFADGRKIKYNSQADEFNKIVSHFIDGGQDKTDSIYPYILILFIGLKKYTVEFTTDGWNFLGEPRAFRRLDKAVELIIYIDTLLES